MSPSDPNDPATNPAPEPDVTGASGERHSVIDRVERMTGGPVRISLQDADSPAEQPIVDPKARDTVRFPAARHHYQVLGEIARGGMGVVLKAYDTELGREVAIKVLDERFQGTETVLQRFVEEAQIGGQLQHPGVVPVYELGLLDDQRPFIAMKLVKGRTLSALLSDRSDPAEDRPRFLGILESICQTVAYAHSKGVIHRDLKPANVMVGAFGEVQVGDWGLSKVLGQGGIRDEKRARASHLSVIETVRSGPGSVGSDSMVGSVMGTPAYMPPEQAMGQIESIDERSDVFALGAILCQILTGKPPYIGTEQERTVVMAAHGRIDAARERLEACDADEALKALALECLAPARTVRPRNGGEVAQRIQVHLASADERARAAELAAAEAEVKVAAARRERALTFGLASAVLLSVLTAGFFLRSRARSEREQVAQVRIRAGEGIDQALDLRAKGQLTEALEVARSTESFVRESPRAEPELLARVQKVVVDTAERVDELRSDEELAQRNVRMLERLEELRFLQLEALLTRNIAELPGRYAAAFEAYGAPLDFDDPDPFFEAVRWSGIEVPLAQGLEGWALAQRTLKGWEDHRARILVLLAKDLDPDPLRNELRDAVLEGDVAGMRALTKSIGERGGSAEAQFLAIMSEISLPRSQSRTSFEGDLYELTAKHYPDSLALTCVQAFALQFDNRLVEAIYPLRAAVALSPNSGRLRRRLATSIEVVGDLPRALDHWAAARDMGFKVTEANYNLGLIYWDLGRLEEAERAIAQAVDQGSGGQHKSSRTDLNAVRYQLGRITREELLAAYEQLDTPAIGDVSGLAAGLLDHPDVNAADAERSLALLERFSDDSAATLDHYFFTAICQALLFLERNEELLEQVQLWEESSTYGATHEEIFRACFRAQAHWREGRDERARIELARAQRAFEHLTWRRTEAWEQSRLMGVLRAAEAELAD